MKVKAEKHDKTIVNSMVKWLKHCAYDQHGLGSKPTQAIMLCPWKDTLWHLVVSASSYKLQSYLY